MVIYIEYTIWLIDFIMKDLIKKILKEETKDEYILEIPNLRFIPNADLENSEGRKEAWDKLLRLLNGKPFIFDDNLNLYETDITSLGNLQSVNGDLNLYETNITSLGNLQSVNGYLNLYGCANLISLGNLQSVKGYLDLEGCAKLTSLGNLQSVNGSLVLYGCANLTSLGNLQSVGGGLHLGKTSISKKYSEEEIRQMLNVGGIILK